MEEVKFESKEAYETAVQTVVDKTVNDRLGRERKTIATKLGIDSYDKLDEYIETSKQGKTVRDTLQTENTTLKTNVLNQDLMIDMLKVSILPDQMDNTKALVKVKQSKNTDLSFADGLTEVITEMPFLIKGAGQVVTPVTRVGAVVNNSTITKTEQDDYMNTNYGKSKYYTKK